MPKLNLKRGYTHSGKDYGPGNDIEVPDKVYDKETGASPHSDIAAKEKLYQAHLDGGGEPVAPVTPSIAGDISGSAENLTTLRPGPRAAHVTQAAIVPAPAPIKPVAAPIAPVAGVKPNPVADKPVK